MSLMSMSFLCRLAVDVRFSGDGVWADVSSPALRAVTAEIEVVDKLHERFDCLRLIGEDPRFKVATVLAFRSHACPGKIC